MTTELNHHTEYAGMIRILLVDDHGLVRESLSTALGQQPGLAVVGTAADADEAIGRTLELEPDVVVLDIDMPGISCFDSIQIIRSRRPQTRFLLLTAFEHDEHIEQALRVKADGFVVKTEGLEALVRAVREVMAGRLYFSPEVMRRLVIRDSNIRLEGAVQSRLSTLSPRERELLRVLARGASLKEAANILGISYKTADKQKTSLMTKLDIHDRVELARFAIREGLVEP